MKLVLIVLVLGAAAFVWLRIRDDDKATAEHDRQRTALFHSEQDLERRGAPRGPYLQLLDIESKLSEENPGNAFPNPYGLGSDVDCPRVSRGEIHYLDETNHEVRLFFQWTGDRWVYQSRAIRKRAFFNTNENEPGSETAVVSNPMEAFLSKYNLAASTPAARSTAKDEELNRQTDIAFRERFGDQQFIDTFGMERYRSRFGEPPKATPAGAWMHRDRGNPLEQPAH